MALHIAIFAFAADISSHENRTFRITVISLGYYIALPLGTPMGSWLYDLGGYALVYGVKLGLLILSLVCLIIRLWNFKELATSHDFAEV